MSFSGEDIFTSSEPNFKQFTAPMTSLYFAQEEKESDYLDSEGLVQQLLEKLAFGRYKRSPRFITQN